MKRRRVLVCSGKRNAIKNRVEPLIGEINRLFPNSDIEFETSALSQLDFYIDKHNTIVYDDKKKSDIAEYDLVVFRTIGDYKEEAMALAIYLTHKGTKFIDTKYPLVSGRLGSALGRWDGGLSIPRTAYGTKNGLLVLLDKIGLPAILKATDSRKGRDNYLVKSKEELADILDMNPNQRFVLQQFIPNNGDYRILVMGGRDVVVSLRQGKGDTHLNNVSAGGTEELISAATVHKEVRLAKRAAKKDGLQMAGVDIITDKDTGEPYILEVNRAPQLTINEEVASFYGLIEKITSTNKMFGKPATVIGRRTNVKMRTLGIRHMVAKIDTGAFSSSLHAENVRVDDGILKFDIVPSEFLKTRSGEVEHCEFKEFESEFVMSSMGHRERRYSIRTKISINKRVFLGKFFLSDRSAMGYPLLIGRHIIRSRFVVNVELDEDSNKTWRY